MGLRYLGHGEFIPGVPARDLTAEEAARWAGVVAEHRRNTGRALYGALDHEADEGASKLALAKRSKRAGHAVRAEPEAGADVPASKGPAAARPWDVPYQPEAEDGDGD